jgi:hypothetical protein
MIVFIEIDTMRIIRLAIPKDKIAKYKISDPFLIFFINKYETTINWNEIESSEDINKFIQDKLLPDLYSKTDPKAEVNNYIKDIDIEEEYRRNANNPQIQQAYQVYQQNPEKAKQQLMDHVNGSKKKAFQDWVNYLSDPNSEYIKHPAFVYSMLKPILDISSENDKRSTYSQNAMAIAAVFNKIKETKGKENVNMAKFYEKVLENTNQKSLNFVSDEKDSKNGWIVIPSGKKDPQNLEKNKKILKDYSIPNGWCTGSGMENTYLPMGDFHLYIVNGSAKVAIRFNGSTIAEIRGYKNATPFAYWQEIVDYIDKNGFDKNSHQYKELEEAITVNNNFEKDEKYRKEYINQIKGDVTKYDMLKNEFKAIPEVKEANKQGWIVYIQNSPNLYENCPPELRHEPKIFEAAKEYWIRTIRRYPIDYKQCPREFKNEPEIFEAAKEYWTNKIEKNPAFYTDCPQEFKSIPEIKQIAIKSWANQIRMNPAQYNKAPEELKGELFETAQNAWIKFLNADPFLYSSIPLEFRKMPEFKKAEKKSWLNNLLKNPFLYASIPSEFKYEPEFKEAHKQSWVDYIPSHPEFYVSCPEEFRDIPVIMEEARYGWIQKIRDNPWNYDRAPANLKDMPGVKNAFKESWIALLERKPETYKSIPPQFKNLPEVLEIVNRSKQPKRPLEYASGMNWYKKSRLEEVKNKICFFCGKPLGDKKEISSWYNGCHASCLNKYNRGKQ